MAWKDILGFLSAGAFGATKPGKKFLFGTPEEHERQSTLLPEQQQLYQQLQAALQGQGAGGAFGDTADYYRSLLSSDPAVLEQFFAPEKRNFQENIIPGLSEQFAGMGAGNLSSSGFRNAGIQAGTDLSERLAAIRANLKQQGAQGLAGLGQFGLGNFSQDVITKPGTQGFVSQVAPAAANAAVGYLTGGPGGAVAGGMSSFGKSNPYGGNNQGGTLRRGAY
jgi:hypothetical protein